MKICPQCDKEFTDPTLVHCTDDGAKLVTLAQSSEMRAADPLIGRMLNERIRIDQKVGQGGMGAVYKGEDVLLGRTIAIKVLQPDSKKNAEDVKRFFNEARVVAKLRHQNTIQVFDFGESKSGHCYIAMEFMNGEPLDEHMIKESMSIGRVLEIIEQVCASLEEAHAAGIIHRDLKPDNIFIDRVNNRRLVKVIDFGIAKMVSGGDQLTRAGMVFGTPAFMSPEQARGDTLDPRSDIYSLGAVLFTMLTGRQPFIGENPMEVAVQHITRPLPDIQELSSFGTLPVSIVDLVQRMMAKDREDRPPDVSAVRQELVEIGKLLPDVRVAGTGDTGSMLKSRTGNLAVSTAGELTANALEDGAPLSLVPPPATREAESGRIESAEVSFVASTRRSPTFYVGIAVGAAVAATLIVFAAFSGNNNDSNHSDSGGGSSNGQTSPAVVHDDVNARETGGASTSVPDDRDESGTTVALAATDAEAATTLGGAAFIAAVQSGGGAVELGLHDARRALEAATVRVHIESEPMGATVRHGDVVLGATPVHFAGARGSAPIEVRMELEGYEPARAVVALDEDATVRTELVATRARDRTRQDDERTGERERTPTRDRDGTRADARDDGRSSETSTDQTGDEGRRGRGGFGMRDPVTIPTDDE